MSLRNGVKKTKHSKRPGAAKIAPAVFEGLESRTLLSASQLFAAPSLVVLPDAAAGSIAGYSPAQIRSAYGFSSVTLGNGAAGTGAGETIAIVDAYNDTDISGDLSAFDSQFGLHSPSLKVVGETGSTTALPAANAGWDLETSLDVEWAHAIAPSASILLVEANSASLGDLLTAVNYARSVAGVSVVSMSWGSSEFSSESAYDGYFTTPTGHAGVTFVAASGDEGSSYGPEWPASSPNVLSVGGTTLNLANSSGAYGSETGWADSTGGISRYEREPNYQTDVQLSGAASSPDVAYDANPNTGFAVYDSVTYEGYKGWWEVGGTSAGTPQWSALVAIADQGRAVNGLGALNGASQTLPLLFSLYNSTQYGQAFHDETVGASSRFYSAAPGYDLVTGLGTPKAAYVIQELIGASATGTQNAPTAVTIVATTVKTAGRRITLMNNPPAAAAAASNTAGVSSFPTLTGAPAVMSTISSTTPGDFISAPQHAATSSTSNLLVKTISDADFQTAEKTVDGTPRGFFEDFGNAPAVLGMDRDLVAATGMFTAARVISSVAGTSTDVVEDLLISNASALSQVANTVAVRLYEEDVMIWQETAALLGAGILVGTHFTRTRQSGQLPVGKRKNPKFLCVGE
ncbi:MAG TPA: S53 family peptidase [Tepidisphaeraceae bacterium]|jgi:hypothetical protein|nr:S53 family peptidase [Tepidisphaeraceae bacterium]